MLLKVHYQRLKRKKTNLHLEQILQKNPAQKNKYLTNTKEQP